MQACSRYFGSKATAHLPILALALARGFKQDFDALGDISNMVNLGNYHPYPGSAEPLRNLIPHSTYGKANVKELPFVVTESGYHNYPETNSGFNGVSETASALYLPRLYLEYFAFGAKGT